MDKKATLFLNMIIGDFEPVNIVERSINSAKNSVDGIYITVTYKDKQPSASFPLIKLLKKYNANISYFKWTKNFAEARQFALDQVPKGPFNFVYWQDADDVLANSDKLHKVADEMIVNLQSAVFFEYWYQVELDDNNEVKEILIKHKRERIIKNDGTWRWVGDLHETLISERQENIIKISRDDCHVVHLSDKERFETNIERNIEILENSIIKQNRKDPRPIIYLAKAYLDKARMDTDEVQRKINLDLALNLFHEYLMGSGKPGDIDYQEASGWKEERSTAWSHIAEIAILSKHPEAAIGAYQNAIDEAPQFPSYYIDMAMTFIMLKDFEKARHWLYIGTMLPEPKTTIIQFPRDIKARALETAFHIHIHFNELEKALKVAEQLYELFPNDEFAKQRVETTKSICDYNKVAQSFVFIGKYLEKIKEKSKIGNLVNAIPDEMKKEKFATEMKHLFTPPRIWEDNEIAILCGPGFENWDADSVNTGIGGSEDAVIRMSQELTKKGWKVTVYGNPEKEKDFDGVLYKNWNAINPKDEFNTLILWRAIGFVDIKPRAKFTLLWLHDVPNNPDFTEERMAFIDKIAVLSEYHKSLLKMQNAQGEFINIPDSKIFLTSNGIPEIKNEWAGKPTTLFWGSSPDRGLPYLLNEWPRIKKEVPDAELHVYYGFKVYDAIHANNPQRKAWKNQVLTMMKQDGIIYHDRVGHEELHEGISKCGIWAYPTDFTEISCITAMKAQALGAIPVVTNYAALEETVKNGYKVDVDITTEDGRKEYFDTLISLLKDPKKQEEFRKTMVPWAKEYFLWSNVANGWDKLFRISLQSKKPRNETKTKIRKQLKKASGS